MAQNHVLGAEAEDIANFSVIVQMGRVVRTTDSRSLEVFVLLRKTFFDKVVENFGWCTDGETFRSNRADVRLRRGGNSLVLSIFFFQWSYTVLTRFLTKLPIRLVASASLISETRIDQLPEDDSVESTISRTLMTQSPRWIVNLTISTASGSSSPTFLHELTAVQLNIPVHEPRRPSSEDGYGCPRSPW